MQVAWFTDTWLPNRDGVVNSLLTFKNELEKRGHLVHLFVPGEKDIEEDNIYTYKSKPFKRYPNYRIPSFLSLFSSRTAKIIREIEPDIIHSHSPGIIGIHAVIASFKYSIPLIFTYHTFIEDSIYFVSDSILFQQISKKLLSVWLRWYLRRCSAFIVPSKAAYEEIKQKLITKEAHIIPTGINVERFANGNGRIVRKKLRKEGKIILHVGRIVKEKNLDMLVKVAPILCKSYPDITFLIVGEGPARSYLEKLIKEKGLEKYFFFTGFVKDEELPNYYASADVFVFPSTYETQGIVALEAMAAGLPVVAARCRALPDLIEDEKNGFLFSPNDAQECAKKICMAFESEEIKKEGKRTAEMYSVEKCAEKLLSVYRRVYEDSL
ncbi:MAG: glycosyltransferase family 4 protein [Thermoplasmata archaeon]|nr:MAG: glycosyltransferase family 4 protein [Thermoplasmata archaeon]